MALLPPVGWADVATKQDLAQMEAATKNNLSQMEERINGKLSTLESRLEARMFRTILIANSTSLLTMAGLAFAAARLV